MDPASFLPALPGVDPVLALILSVGQGRGQQNLDSKEFQEQLHEESPESFIEYLFPFPIMTKDPCLIQARMSYGTCR